MNIPMPYIEETSVSYGKLSQCSIELIRSGRWKENMYEALSDFCTPLRLTIGSRGHFLEAVAGKR